MPGLTHFKLKDKVLVSDSGPIGALGLIYLSNAFLKVRVAGRPPLQKDQQVMRMSAGSPTQLVPCRPLLLLLLQEESHGG